MISLLLDFSLFKDEIKILDSGMSREEEEECSVKPLAKVGVQLIHTIATTGNSKWDL